MSEDEKVIPPVSDPDLLRRKGAMERQYLHDRLHIFEVAGAANGASIDAGKMIAQRRFQGLVSAEYAREVADYYGFTDTGI